MIELLVAIVVLGLVATPVLATFITGYSSLVGAGEKTKALNLARQQMEEVKSMGYPRAYLYFIEEGNSPQITRRGLFTLDTRLAPENITIKGSDAEIDLKLELLRVMVDVTWDGWERERSLRVMSYLSNR